MTSSVLWIVPMRRVVIREELDYRALLGEWLTSLSEPNLDKLAAWYRPLAAADLTRPLRTQLSDLRRRIEREYPSGAPRPATPRAGAIAPGQSSLDRSSVRVRLWKGPFRVLRDLERYQANPEYERDFFDWQRCVADPAAKFYPGDVVEFPIFTLVAAAGVTSLRDVVFDPEGSFLDGTSVKKRGHGRGPGPIRIHDNLMAMRFQAILNAALCAWYTKDHPFTPGSPLDENAFGARVQAEGTTVHIRARGIVYGGTLADPMSGRDALFSLSNIGHRDGKALPNRRTLASFPNDSRYTWGWSCNPCQLALAYHMVARTDTWSPGGTPMRHAAVKSDDFHPMVHYTQTQWAAHIAKYFTQMTDADRDVVNRWNRDRARGALRDENSDLVYEDAERLDEAGPGRLPPERRHSRVLQQSIGDPMLTIAPEPLREEDWPEYNRRLRAHYERAQHAVLRRLADTDWLPMSSTQQRDAFARQAAFSDPAERSRYAFQARTEEVTIDEATLRRTLSKTLTPLVLDGHCFTYVRIHPHRLLLDENPLTSPVPAHRDVDPSDASLIDPSAPRVGPPTTGWISAYHPITGAPFDSDHAEGDIFLFEASGSVSMVRTPPGRGGPNAVFGSKNFVWKRVHALQLRATSLPGGGWNVRVREHHTPPATQRPDPPPEPSIPEGTSRRDARRITQTHRAAVAQYERDMWHWPPLPPAQRSDSTPAEIAAERTRYERIRRRYLERTEDGFRHKPLVCFSLFDDARLKQKYQASRAFEQLALSRTGSPRDDSTPHHVRLARAFHARRAVPFETLFEAESSTEIRDRYQPVSTMRRHVTRAITNLAQWRATLAPEEPDDDDPDAPRTGPRSERVRIDEALALLRGVGSTD